MAVDITIHGQTYQGVNAVRYVNGTNSYDLDKLVLNGVVVYEKEAPFPAKQPLEDMSWEDISTVCKAGLASEYWNVGDTKTVSISGESGTHSVRIIGFDHDNVADTDTYGRAKAGATFEMVYMLDSTYAMVNSAPTSSGWKTSTLRSNMTTLKRKLPSDLQGIIVPVYKDCNYGSYSGSAVSYEVATDDVFILSLVELGDTGSEDGTVYSYYVGSSAIDRRKTKTNGNYEMVWTRTFSIYNFSTYYPRYYTLGMQGATGRADGNASRGVALAFCI